MGHYDRVLYNRDKPFMPELREVIDSVVTLGEDLEESTERVRELEEALAEFCKNCSGDCTECNLSEVKR